MEHYLATGWLLAACLTLALDQASKRLIESRSGAQAGSRRGPRIRVVANARIGLGLIQDRRLLVAFWVAALFGTLLLIRWLPPLQEPTALFGLGAASGGATGNLVDMLRRGAVVDFIDLRIWPVFNLADVALVGGVLAAVWTMAVAWAR